MLLKHYLTAFESCGGGGGGVRGEVEGGGGALITSTQDRCGGNRARRPFSHKFVLVFFNHFETHMLDS